jgi:hypothetical protein
MKNTILARFARIFGIIALTAVIVFSMAACDPEPEDEGGGVKDQTISISVYPGNNFGNADGTGTKYKSVAVTFDLERDHEFQWKVGSISADVVRSWFSISHASYDFTTWNGEASRGMFGFSTDVPDGTGEVTVTLNQNKLAEMKNYIVDKEGYGDKPFTGTLKVGKAEDSSSSW